MISRILHFDQTHISYRINTANLKYFSDILDSLWSLKYPKAQNYFPYNLRNQNPTNGFKKCSHFSAAKI